MIICLKIKEYISDNGSAFYFPPNHRGKIIRRKAYSSQTSSAATTNLYSSRIVQSHSVK